MGTRDATAGAVYSRGVPSTSALRRTALRWSGATLLWLIASVGPVIWVRRRWALDVDLADDWWYVAFAIAVGGVCAALLDRRDVLDHRRRPTLIAAVCLVGALTLSAAWSLDPVLTLTHGLRLAATLAVGLLLTTRFTAVEQVGSLWVAAQIGCAWSAVDIVRLVPGSQDARENWVGIFVNRNLFGLVCAVGITAAALLAAHVSRAWCGRRRIGALLLLVSSAVLDAYLLAGSGSATPVGALALLAIGMTIVLALRRVVGATARTPTPEMWPARIVTASAVAVVAVVAASALILPHVAGLAGRNGELSRRRPLWDFVLDQVAERPLWGWGYLGPWDDRGFRRELRTYVSKAWDLHSAHNSVLEVALGAGLVVLLVFLVFLVLGVRCALSRAMQPGVMTLWPLLAVAWFLVESLTETFLVAGTLPTLLLVVGALAVEPGGDLVDGHGRTAGEGTTLTREPRSVTRERDEDS